MKSDLPDDIDQLKALLRKHQSQLRQYAGQVAGYELEINRLKAQLDKLRRMLFGQSSWLGIYGHSRFCNTDIEDIVGLHESIRRLHGPLARATMSSAPVEPYKFERHSVCHS